MLLRGSGVKLKSCLCESAEPKTASSPARGGLSPACIGALRGTGPRTTGLADGSVCL